jgi:two-component system NtrC family sensor kinase
VYAEAKRCHRVVQNLLTFARRHAPEKTWIGVNDIIESVVDLRAYQLRVDNIEVRKSLSKDIPLTMGDFHQLQQVFMNIIINAHQAFKVSQKGRSITLTSDVVDGCIRVTIADDGPGIPAQNLQKVFDPFFTTKEPGQGTGLGLSLCYGIIEEHQGRIRVDSEPGEGSVFTIDLPVIAPGSAEAEGVSRGASHAGSGRTR